MKPPVTRLPIYTVTLNNGNPFQVVSDISESGNRYSFDSLLEKWRKKTKTATAADFVKFVKKQLPDSIFISKEAYDKITEGKVITATKEEYDAENN